MIWRVSSFKMQVQGEEVTFGHDPVEVVRRTHEVRLNVVEHLGFDLPDVDAHDLHAERLGPAGQRLAARAETHDAQCLVLQLVSERIVHAALP